jgi:hypothetical protein
MENAVISQLVENNGEEYVSGNLNGALHDSYSEEFISDFINAFEDNKEKKIAAAKPRKKKKDAAVSVFDEFMEKLDANPNSSPT